ncbi:hypothetical protein ACQEVB_22330 [Pseudonocardia sp. CA-107938]|uniref:hypothetical protein n=1 Tax=Pseudonocardia sp. CA-107938 TaxID=3240021 RepID=UPI003D8A119F
MIGDIADRLLAKLVPHATAMAMSELRDRTQSCFGGACVMYGGRCAVWAQSCVNGECGECYAVAGCSTGAPHGC